MGRRVQPRIDSALKIKFEKDAARKIKAKVGFIVKDLFSHLTAKDISWLKYLKHCDQFKSVSLEIMFDSS